MIVGKLGIKPMSPLAHDLLPPSLAKLEGDVAGVREAVAALRDAIREGDVDAVQEMRWLAPRPPGERDLLSDMAAAEGITPAIKRLSGFWRRAEVLEERVRPLDGLEAEVYERLTLPAESLPIVTVVRRGTRSDPWKVVCTNEAYDERLVLWIPVAVEELDDVALMGDLPDDTQLLMDGRDGVLAHDHWLVHVRGPVEPEAWPETLPGETGRVVELATALSPTPADRRRQLRWLLRSAAALLPHVGGHALYLRRERRVLVPGAIDAILRREASPGQALQFWCQISAQDGFVHTDGLRLLGLPEIEMDESLLGCVEQAHALVDWLAQKFVKAEESVALGTEITVGEESLVVLTGRRGPRRGRSYGRCGAIQLARIEGSLVGSRSRLRAPDELVRG